MPVRFTFVSPAVVWVALLFLMAGGCAKYTTPGKAVSPSTLGDWDIEEILQREPASPFPARIAVVRVQGSGYSSKTASSYGKGRYSVITTRTVEQDADIERIAKLPLVAGVASLNQLIIPYSLNSDKELRMAAASVKADLLLLYTFNTVFRVKDHDIGPLGVISLGMLPNHEAMITCTVSAAIYDVRTGYIYGLAEATARENEMTSKWTSSDTVDDARKRAERAAFELLIDEVEKTWTDVVNTYVQRPVGGSLP